MMRIINFIRFFFIKNQTRVAYIILISSSLVASISLLEALSPMDKETQDAIGNILVLLLLGFSTRLKTRHNYSLSLLVDFFTVTIAAVLSFHLFNSNSRDFFTVTNEILAVVIVPYVLYSPVKERKIEKRQLLDKLLKIESTSNSETQKLTDGQHKADNDAMHIVKSYIEKINHSLESYSGANRTISIPVKDSGDMITLCRSFQLIQEYYRSQSYEFLLKTGRQEITIRWPFIK